MEKSGIKVIWHPHWHDWICNKSISAFPAGYHNVILICNFLGQCKSPSQEEACGTLIVPWWHKTPLHGDVFVFWLWFWFLENDARSELFTLQGINISPWYGIFEDDFPFPQVGYVNSLEGRSWVQETKFFPRIHQKSFGFYGNYQLPAWHQVKQIGISRRLPPSNQHRCHPNHQCLMLKHLPKNGEHVQVRKDILKEKLPNTWRKRRGFSVISQLPKVCGLAKWQLSPWGAQFGSFHSSIGQALSFSCWTVWRVRWCCLVRRAASVGFVFREAAR